MEERAELVELDLSKIQTSNDLQTILKETLGFPSFYGMNWDAFWDSITGLVELPKVIKITGWSILKRNLPCDSTILKECLEDLNLKHPSWSCNVHYID
ncbi:barstar family protein [Paenibacillus roseipurpureus]|uniref:Barstar family protein n=1 Tax=Paenibacillus roseopurpureus TaxID=2918901 RepID=A0AA96LQY7_9BACL|nr:barstar family protein [Paenibacillus sp. MBLB1832]WNR44409.1 barstar family protein [Paenibacillus sp. MBLB1832]